MQNWLRISYLDLTTKEMLPFNLPELNPLLYYVWENVRGLSRAPSNTVDIAELKEMLQMEV